MISASKKKKQVFVQSLQTKLSKIVDGITPGNRENDSLWSLFGLGCLTYTLILGQVIFFKNMIFIKSDTLTALR